MGNPFLSPRQQRSAAWTLAGILGLLCAGPGAAQQPSSPSAVIIGRVLAESGPAVGEAEVVLDSLRSTRTDPNGLFRFDSLPAGRHRLEVRAIGFNPVAATIELFGGSADAVITLKAAAQPLPEIFVRGGRFHLNEVGFYKRKATERGRFLETDTLARLDSLSLLRALSRLPGFRFARPASLDPDVASTACGGFTVWLNGWLVRDEDKAFVLRVTHPREVDGVEIYEDATAPMVFQDPSRLGGVIHCVVAIWDH